MNDRLEKNIKYSGFVAGLSCALVGTAIFSVIEVARLSIIVPFSSHSLSLILTIFFFGLMFSSIPAGIGGLVLGLLLQNKMKKGSLTLAKSVKTGIFLAGVVAIITCACGMFFILLSPHNNWHYFWEDVRHNPFSINFTNYFHYDLKVATRFAPEILIAIIIACISGGWTGRLFYKKYCQPAAEKS